MPMETIVADYLLGADESGLIISSPVLSWLDGKIVSVTSESKSRILQNTKLKILAPGFINGHAHLELHRDQPVEYHANFGQWLIDVACEFGSTTEEDKIIRAKKSAELLLSNGCTFINDVSSSGESAKALSSLGLRGIVNLEYFHPHHHPNEVRLNRLEELYYRISDLYKNHANIFIGVSPHSPYNVSPCGLSEVLTRLKPMWIHTHMAESQAEKDWFATPLPDPPPQGGRGYIMDIDAIHQKFIGEAFGPQFKGSNGFEHFESILKEFAQNSAVTFAHGNYLSSLELQAMAKAHWGLFSCPCSNQFFNHPALDIQNVLNQTVLVGLGTDGLVSNTQLDLRAEARVLIQRGVSAIEAFKILTINAVKALQLEKLADLKLGQLQENYSADFVLYETALPCDVDSPAEIYNALFNDTTTIESVWVGGKIIFKK